ncbi:hypothetical protein MLD38_001036 [Melastoma candidum]|uniref:Uncharacterized protein n=1 Tax=Melastoma candidum TaxID=119954 RepID=A0ACB9SFA4_9MYRT|nr:hypothetical protein MLD38_001036 [Melastoma candidum]
MSSPLLDDSVGELQSQVESLRKRIEELEAENAKLSSRLSCCCCHQRVSPTKDISRSVVGTKGEIIKANGKKSSKVKGGSMLDLMNFPKRYVALRVTYFGQRYYGFASEAQQEPTVESELFKALEKTRLSIGDKRQAHYSRCGRTDKGVSSVGQVIALFLRSSLRDDSITNDREIDYVGVLNRVLPEDIRVTGWCPVTDGFSARFSCLSREYKYFFWRNNLDTVSMKLACDKLVGEHDFRNFCKMDAVNVHNYRRHISSFTLSSCDRSYKGNELWAFHIKGSAFLWHQVRCMVAVLFMIGQGIESPNVIDALLDTEKTPRKPQYIMAPEVPLVLQSCQFEGLNFLCSSDAWKALHLHLENAARDFELRAAICNEALHKIFPKDHVIPDLTSLSNGTKRKPPSHIPLMQRPTEPSYDERQAKFKSNQEARGLPS